MVRGGSTAGVESVVVCDQAAVDTVPDSSGDHAERVPALPLIGDGDRRPTGLTRGLDGAKRMARSDCGLGLRPADFRRTDAFDVGGLYFAMSARVRSSMASSSANATGNSPSACFPDCPPPKILTRIVSTVVHNARGRKRNLTRDWGEL